MNVDPSHIPIKTFFHLFDEPFYAYCKKDHTITIYNAGSSSLYDGTFSLSDFIMLLRSMLTEDDFPSLDSFEKHLEKQSENFSLTFANNFLNNSEEVVGVMIKGMLVETDDGCKLTIGNIHPRASRRVSMGDEIDRDPLTGLINKVDMAKISIETIDRDKVNNTYIAIIDIDYFKYVNDNYGHQYGDLVLTQVADIIRSDIGKDGLVGRIGGDEFFVLFTKPLSMSALRDHLQNIRILVNKTFENKGPRENTPISVSMGVAKYPDDAKNYNDLFVVADYCLYLAKEKGKNRYIIYTPEKHPTLSDMKKRKEEGAGSLAGRENLPLGDVLIQSAYMIMYEKSSNIERIFSDFAKRFKLPFVMIAGLEDKSVPVICGEQARTESVITSDLIDALNKFHDRCPKNSYDFYVCNNVTHIEGDNEDLIDDFTSLGLVSFISIPFPDFNGKKMTLFFASFGQNLVWNEQHFMYFRMMRETLTMREF
ncbi:MAG: GGDEF domain-containing protein [Lachnospiraceae bacterium]|nr:GGDEF domain-containing protein [Lachnospiraceae bacterium]